MSRRLFKSTLVAGSMTFISRISGLVRDILFARLIGAGTGVAADAFYVAFRIPNFLRRIFGEGAFSQAFVPVLAEYQHQRPNETRILIARVTGALALVLLIVTVIGTLTAPWVVMALAPGFADEPTKFGLTVGMLQIMFPYLLFISLVALAGGVLNTYGRFAVPAFTPVLLNACLIVAAAVVAPRLEQPVLALAWGVFFAGLVQLIFQFPSLARLRLLVRPQLQFDDPGVRRVGRLMIPGIFSVSIAQINLLVNTILASFLITGSVSWLYYADRLMEFPLGVFAVALGTVILPALSQKHAKASKEEFSRTLDWSLRLGLIVSVPAMVGLVVLAQPLLITLFQYGAFTPADARMTAAALVAFAVGMPGFVLVKILAPGFYARQEMRTPVRVGVIAMVANIVASLVLIKPLGHVGLAAATSVAGILNAVLLYVGLRRANVYRPAQGWPRLWLQVGLAALVMGALLWWDGHDATAWLSADVAGRVTRLAFWVAVGVLTYVALLWLFGVRWRKVLSSQQQSRQEQ